MFDFDGGGPGPGRNREVDALMRAVRWPSPDLRTVLILAGQLLATRRYEQGYEFFTERAKAEPGNALYEMMAGLFQARAGGDPREALARLDAAAARQPGLPNYFRGLVLSRAPAFAGRLDTAVSDLELVLGSRDFPAGFRRAAHLALAGAYAAQGRHGEAGSARERSGPVQADDVPILNTDWSVSVRDGIRFTSPRLTQPVPGVYHAQGFDFSDFAFVTTADGVVAIDASSSVRHAREALAELRTLTKAPITHVILTHAHWDHVGGLPALVGPGTVVISQAGFAEELALQGSVPVISPYFLPEGASQRQQITPDRLVAERETLSVGGVDFVLHPITGGETRDGLLIHLPDRETVFTGDMIMPYVGAPFLPEGSPEGLLESMRLVQDLGPRLLIHGHAPLTEFFTISVFPGLEAALRDLHRLVVDAIAEGETLIGTLHRNHLPDLLRQHPEAVPYYLMLRDNMIKRMYHQRTGYWKSGGDGIEDIAPADWAGALHMLAGDRTDAFPTTAERLLERGEEALALRIVDYGLHVDPDSARLTQLRRGILLRLIERNQQLDPFKFIYYSGLAGLEIPLPR